MKITINTDSLPEINKIIREQLAKTIKAKGKTLYDSNGNSIGYIEY